MSASTTAQAFPVGEFLTDELEARGWTQADFADVLGRPVQFVSEIIAGKKEITRESAAQIGAALGTSAQVWLNLQDSYMLWKQSQDKQAQAKLDEVKTRARLRELAPVSLLVKRGYVNGDDLDNQTRDVLELYGMGSFEDEPEISFAARRSNTDERVTTLQLAWVACVKQTAEAIDVAPFDREGFGVLARSLSARVREEDSIADFQRLFSEVGVKLVYVEAFPGGKLDGCSMMVGGHPVIGVSGRSKRLDKVLFTILHEVAHVLLGDLDPDGGAIADDLTGGENGSEDAVNELASRLAISHELPEVPQRVSYRWIHEQAARLDVHPLTLIGRLQKDGLVPWRTALVKNPYSVTDHLKEWIGSRGA